MMKEIRPIREGQLSQKEIKELLVPRISEDDGAIPGASEEYLNWLGLVMLFRDVFPDGDYDMEEISDTPQEVKFKCSVWKSKDAPRPEATVWYKMMYTDDVADTYQSCQTLALRRAIITAGVGTNIVLEEEIQRRQNKLQKSNEVLEKNTPMTAGEMFEALQAKVVTSASAEKVSQKAASENKTAKSHLTEDPFEAAGITARRTEILENEEPAAVSSPSGAEEEAAPENALDESLSEKEGNASAAEPQEEAAAEVPAAAKEDAKAPEKVEKKPLPRAKKAEKADREAPRMEASAAEAPAGKGSADSGLPNEYIIQPGDFLIPAYNKRYAGKKLGALGDSSLKAVVNNSSVITPAFKAEIEAYLARA